MKNSKALRIALFILLAAGITLAVLNREQFDATALENWVRSAGAAAPLAFMGIYIIATVLFLPGSVLTLAGGALFGPVWGTLYSLTGATIGATLAFLVARYLAADWVRDKSGERLTRIMQGVDEEGWRFVAFVRLVPLFPFNLLNYALGLTRIPVLAYVITSFICMFPGAVAYTYLGYAAREVIAGDSNIKEMIQTGSIALALLAVVIFLPRLIKRFRKPSASDTS